MLNIYIKRVDARNDRFISFSIFLDELLNLFKTNRYLLIILMSLVVLLIPIYFENYNINNLNVLDYQPPEQYQNNAPVDIIYNFDLKEFINQPTKYASSFIANPIRYIW